MDHTRERRLEALPGWAWDAQEAAWEEGFAHLLKFVEREGHARVPKGWHENGYRLGQWVEVQRGRRRKLDPQRKARLEALPRWVWNTKEADWEQGFAHLISFVEREGHARVPLAWREDGVRLGQWVGVQRAMRGRRIREPQRDSRLEALPGWVWDTNEAAWEDGFAHLVSFVEREGHARVPRGWDENGYRLGQWVIVQRSRRKTLDQKRLARLEALPDWTWSLKAEIWEEGFAHLVSFAEREGHVRVPGHWTEQGFHLGGWVRNQRSRRRTLGQERRARLEALPGWVWNMNDAAWEEGFTRLVKFAEREGHTRMTAKYREDGFALGAWVHSKRYARKRGELAEQRVGLLEALPGWRWDDRDRRPLRIDH